MAGRHRGEAAVNISTRTLRTRRAVWRGLAWLSATLLALSLAAMLALYFVLAPLPGEWRTALTLGPLTLQAGVPSLLRLATAPWVAPLLDGTQWRSRIGTLHVRKQADTGGLALHCAPCTLHLHGLGDTPLQLERAELTVQREQSTLRGRFSAGAVQGQWQGELTAQQLQLSLNVPDTAVADAYALLRSHIPEVARARINGRFSLSARVALPGGAWQLKPQIKGFEVSGLGTQALLAAQSHCGPSGPSKALAPDSTLARAVIAAEDQRFWTHTGYDLKELAAAFDANQTQGRIVRGGSTLSQQLAKLLITGPERSALRKLRELLYAADMEQSLGKARILRLYLENAPWGHGLCGAHAAAKHYFGVSTQRLAPAQAVWLAAMLHNPGMEARRWAQSGQIDLARAQWVAQAVRGVSRRERQRLLAAIGQAADWPAPPLQPTARPPG